MKIFILTITILSAWTTEASATLSYDGLICKWSCGVSLMPAQLPGCAADNAVTAASMADCAYISKSICNSSGCGNPKVIDGAQYYDPSTKLIN